MAGKITFEQLMKGDALLAAGGIKPLTPWWTQQLRRFYEHPTAMQLVARVGRGGAKSYVAVKCLVLEAVFGDWQVGIGETHFIAFVSTNLAEAAQRLNLVAACLSALHEPFARNGDEILLTTEGKRIGFKTFACRVGAVSGWRCIGFSDDELAKQMADPDAAEPAHEVLVSLRAMAITQPAAHKFLPSSPVGKTDEHALAFALGDTDDQLVCTAPSWVANPSITEAQTHIAERDRRAWEREYAAIPQDAALAAFPSELIDEAFDIPDTVSQYYTLKHPVLIADPSSGGGDTWAYAVAEWIEPYPVKAGLRPMLFVDRVSGWQGNWREHIGEIELKHTVQNFCREIGVRHAISDNYDAPFFRSMCSEAGIRADIIHWAGSEQDHLAKTPWGMHSGSKQQAGYTLRRWLQNRSIKLVVPDVKIRAKLRQQLLNFKEKVTPSGSITFEGGRGHDDFAALLLTLAMADSLKLLPSSPIGDRIPESLWQQIEAANRGEGYTPPKAPSPPGVLDYTLHELPNYHAAFTQARPYQPSFGIYGGRSFRTIR